MLNVVKEVQEKVTVVFGVCRAHTNMNNKHINKRPPNMSMQHQPVSYKVIKFHKSPSIKRLFDIELLNKKLLIVV